jgi:atypical dual specificity phosphatase
MRLPYDCDWIVEDQLCAMSLPDEAVIERLRELGFTMVVSVAAEEYAAEVGEWCLDRNLRWLRYHVWDMTAPDLEHVRDFVAEVDAEIRRGGRVAVHCLGGVGRTGTMAACYLVSRGASSREAVAEVRARRPGSIQTAEQELVVHRYGAEVFRSRAVRTDS